MKKLTPEQIISLHSQLISATGGIEGTRDKGLVESAIANVFDSYFGVENIKVSKKKLLDSAIHLLKIMLF